MKCLKKKIMKKSQTSKRRHPEWIKTSLPSSDIFYDVKDILKKNKLNTICENALCPNCTECFSKKTATFLIMGNICTRNCKYCNIKTGIPEALDINEPKRIANGVKELGLKHVVLTSVTRDDLKDYGASHFADTINEIKKESNATIEALIPDFRGSEKSLQIVLKGNIDVLNHNIECAKTVFSKMRPMGDYEKSLELLKKVKTIKKIFTKSGFMIGLGETTEDIKDTIRSLKNADVDIITIGQYLQPSQNNPKVEKYYSPKEFEEFKIYAEELGFKHVESGPLVRSSYNAIKAIEDND